MAKENAPVMKEKKKNRFPDVYALLFILCIAAMVLTWIIPAGAFDRVAEGSINRVVAGSFHYIDGVPQNPWDMLQCIYQGFINSSSTIFMIFFCGAAIGMLEESKSLSTAFTVMANKLRGKEAISMAVIMFGLGLGNSAGVFGNLGIAIVPIGIYLARAMNGDDFLGFLIIYFGLMSGFSIGFANPGILGVAQTIAEIPIFSGTLPRLICCVANITFLYIVTVFYYKRIQKDPTCSLNYEPGMQPYQYIGNARSGGNAEDPSKLKLNKRQAIVVVFFLVAVVACVSLTIINSWGTKQISAWFLGTAVIVGILSGFDMNDIAKKFIKNCAPMVSASFVVGIASSVALILSNGQVMDTIVNALSAPLAQMGAVAGAGFMVVINALINILIPSGSGQAAVVMPLMTPIADLVGITRQVAVQAFQFGDGLSNLATPLNGPLMGCLAIAGVSFPKYFKWAIKFILIEIAVATIVTMGLQAAGWVGY
ncbi:YfcC family protein [Angelakisella massiliensis]|uniref:YfcC family protein n=1 Tax=Angelakisella massiliensis TaxID=1871018 RepID=UPI0023A7B353|nr:TIGR00366 family protein [Angelakisella massiliensis]